MRISDWSSDVCSSDLLETDRPAEAVEAAGYADRRTGGHRDAGRDDRAGDVVLQLHAVDGDAMAQVHVEGRRDGGRAPQQVVGLVEGQPAPVAQIGRASCREGVCQYGSISCVAVSLKKNSRENEKQNKRYTN